jgi:hypothetical protein
MDKKEIIESLKEARNTLQFLWDNSKPDHDKTNWTDYFNVPANTIQMLDEKIRKFEALSPVDETQTLPNICICGSGPGGREVDTYGNRICTGCGKYGHIPNFPKPAVSNGELLERAKDEWISVEDRLPEEKYNIKVLILTSYGGMDVCYLDGENSFRNAMRPQHTNGSVTHWIPLPEPPKI